VDPVPERPTTTPTLTYGLRELVWGIESSVAVISNLSRQIDEHVEALNALRAEAAERLLRLDALAASTQDPHLELYLRSAVDAPLPQVPEHFPPRMYD
jgi:hypothetical protein